MSSYYHKPGEIIANQGWNGFNQFYSTPCCRSWYKKNPPSLHSTQRTKWTGKKQPMRLRKWTLISQKFAQWILNRAPKLSVPLPRTKWVFFLMCTDFSAANAGFYSSIAETVFLGKWQKNAQRNDLQGHRRNLGIPLLKVNHPITLLSSGNLFSLHWGSQRLMCCSSPEQRSAWIHLQRFMFAVRGERQ